MSDAQRIVVVVDHSVALRPLHILVHSAVLCNRAMIPMMHTAPPLKCIPKGHNSDNLGDKSESPSKRRLSAGQSHLLTVLVLKDALTPRPRGALRVALIYIYIYIYIYLEEHSYVKLRQKTTVPEVLGG